MKNYLFTAYKVITHGFDAKCFSGSRRLNKCSSLINSLIPFDGISDISNASRVSLA